MRGLAITIVLIAGLVSSPAFAWDDLTDESSNKQCGFAATFDGPGSTRFVVYQKQDQFDDGDIAGLIVANDNWSLTFDEEIQERITIDANHGAYKLWKDTPISIPHGFGFRVTYAQLKDLADSRPTAVFIYKGKQVIDKLDFSGFSLAWLAFDACHDKKVAAKLEHDRKVGIERDIPRDPFAKTPAPFPAGSKTAP